MKRAVIAAAAVVGASLFAAIPASANDPHSAGSTGQPSQSCQSFFGNNGPFTPNGFNTAGFQNATTHYAGSQPQNSKNSHSVAQYDVACFQAAMHAAAH